MKDKYKIIFTRKVSRSGKNIVKIISIPKTIHPLIEYGKKYKITIEELENEQEFQA
jgi:hypothetical protein